jgi:hypothetical protein
MRLLAGLGLVALGLLVLVFRLHVRELRYFDRPGVARHRTFDPILAVVAGMLLLGGLAAAGAASPPAAAAVALLLLLLWGYRRIVRGLRFQAWLLGRDFRALRSERPADSDEQILLDLLMRRHPSWGRELIEQMVADHPTIEGLARTVARMERGFRGFRP